MKFFENLFSDFYDDDYAISGLNSELFCIYVYDAFIKKNKGFLVVSNSTYEANKIYNSLLNYTDKVLFFPMDDFLTSEAIAVSPEFKAERINTLNQLVNNENYIVVTNLMGYLRYLPMKSKWSSSIINLKKGMDIDRDELIKSLFDIGYERETIVTGTGKIGVRGYVIDVYPISSDNAVRIEFWGDTIDSIKYFDIDSQLTTKEINEVSIYPYSEFLIDDMSSDVIQLQKYLKHYCKDVASISSYLTSPDIFFYDYNTILKGYDLLVQTINQYDSENHGDIKTKYMNSFDDIKCSQKIFSFHFDDDINLKKVFKFKYSSINSYNGNYELIRNDILNYLKCGKTVIICIDNKETAKRIIKYLEIDDINLAKVDISVGKINIINFNLLNGFIFNDYVVFGMSDLFNIKEEKTKYKSKYKIGTRLQSVIDIQPGDYVVHELFGIGIYQGLFTLSSGNLKKDYLKVLYANNDSLYIPVENIDRISKFTGRDSLSVSLDSLSSDKWSRRKNKVKEKLESIAADLLKVSVERESSSGFAFSKDDENQVVFDNEFIYEETDDQKKAILEIKNEMENKKPMDMLLCGDVGYGKTEVAFRAMFKAVNDGKQVAYLCPTTILSNQQYESAKSRFATFPVNIALINRFVDRSTQNKIISDLKEGKIDIIFGTHRLLSDDISYKNLGLLVVDEEQRFGVTHKEKIKKIKSNIDVLTLSATPIPRTLQMSMSGIRSLALIETPPKERYPIQTYVMEESNMVIKDAIYKELSRNGQVFVLYNSVEKIENKVNELKKLIPEAKIDFAHGKMMKNELEDKMNSFISGDFNVLVCTTIIETGIDIPNVNTLIIIDADRFGLSQLYQIRGRIGRSNKIGYAYLMYNKNKFLTDSAIKRLDVIKEFTELGSGFKIAKRDLAIRGAGDILGREQSGFIDSIGIDLYLKMLNDAIKKSKGETVSNEKDEVKNDKPLISVSTSIDDSYVDDTELKIAIHKMINEINSYDSFCKTKDHLEDRFGKLNESLIIYMYEEWFESLAKSLNISDVKDENNTVTISLPEDIGNKISGDKLFIESYNISKMFKFMYRNKKIYISLDKNNLNQHYLMLLIALLIKIRDMMR